MHGIYLSIESNSLTRRNFLFLFLFTGFDLCCQASTTKNKNNNIMKFEYSFLKVKPMEGGGRDNHYGLVSKFDGVVLHYYEVQRGPPFLGSL